MRVFFRRIRRHIARLATLTLTVTAFVFAASGPASAVSSFAQQTGQPCHACHVGNFGPQLTPFGRQFKMQGYTLRAGRVFETSPFAAMAVGGYTHTAESQDEAPEPHTSKNDNLTFDEASLFFAASLGDHFGAFVQTTYDGVGRSLEWDNVDLRAVTNATLGGENVLLGLSLNNSPTVQDPFNTTPVWGFPYTDSPVAPGPEAATLISDALAQNVVGLSGYAVCPSGIYTEVGLYVSPSRSFIDAMGVDPDETSEINDAAPYARIAYQTDAAGGTVEVGAFSLYAELYPGRDKSTGTTDNFLDLGLDGSYYRMLESGDTFTANIRYTHEHQDLSASYLLGDASDDSNTLQDLRADVSYYFADGVGGTIGAFNTWGSTDPMLYPDSRTHSPNSTGFIFQVDATPWGRNGSPLGDRFNARIGIQYVAYTKFDGAGSDYDGAGRNASDNNTIRLFAWLAY